MVGSTDCRGGVRWCLQQSGYQNQRTPYTGARPLQECALYLHRWQHLSDAAVQQEQSSCMVQTSYRWYQKNWCCDKVWCVFDVFFTRI